MEQYSASITIPAHTLLLHVASVRTIKTALYSCNCKSCTLHLVAYRLLLVVAIESVHPQIILCTIKQKK